MHRSIRALILLLLLTGTGCAYFNTFYFAKKYYSQGERGRQAAASQDLASPEAARRYDQAIAQCRKVLAKHAGSRWADDALYLMGASYYGKAAYDSALIVFRDLQKAFPQSKFVKDAIYKSGLCHYERGNYEEMEAEFARVMEIDPDYEHEDDILYTLAQRAEKEGDRTSAVRSYRRLVDRFAGSERSEDGLSEIGRLYFEAEEYDSALAAYEELVSKTKDQKNYQEGQLQLAQCLIRLGRAEEAIRRLQDQIPRNLHEGRTEEIEYAARVRITLAQAYNRTGRHDEALNTLRVVLDNNRGTASAGEAAYLIGYTYESYLDSLQAAEKAYEEAASMSARTSSFRDLARNRLTNLKRLIALSGEASSGGDASVEKAAEAVLKIAELHYFSQNEVPEALAQYEKVLDQFPESKIAPRAAYAIAWIHLHEEDLPADTAVVRLRDLVETYPASDQARAAIDLLQTAGADTSGLGALLVETEPDTMVAAEAAGAPNAAGAPVDSLGIPVAAGPDSSGAVPDSLRGALDPRERLRPDRRKFVDEDGLPNDPRASARDSVGIPGPDSVRFERTRADSLAGSYFSPPDSLVDTLSNTPDGVPTPRRVP